jgi:hypothetical protein
MEEPVESFIEKEVKTIPSYDGNGWSKYQILVLNQLGDHSRAIKQLWASDTKNKIRDSLSEKENNDFKERQIEIKKTLDNLNSSIKTLNERIDSLEKKQTIKEGIDSGMKAYWGFIGAGLAFIINFLFTKFDRVISFFQHVNE